MISKLKICDSRKNYDNCRYMKKKSMYTYIPCRDEHFVRTTSIVLKNGNYHNYR